jgi:hypothetical protein
LPKSSRSIPTIVRAIDRGEPLICGIHFLWTQVGWNRVTVGVDRGTQVLGKPRLTADLHRFVGVPIEGRQLATSIVNGGLRIEILSVRIRAACVSTAAVILDGLRIVIGGHRVRTSIFLLATGQGQAQGGK